MSSSSGIKCASDITEFIKDIHNQKFRYVTFCIRPGPKSKLISVDKKGEREKTFFEFAKDLPAREPRYAVYDFTYTIPSGETRNRMLLIFWSPFQTAEIEGKTLYSSSKSNMWKVANSVIEMKNVEITEPSELTEDQLLDVLKPKREKQPTEKSS